MGIAKAPKIQQTLIKMECKVAYLTSHTGQASLERFNKGVVKYCYFTGANPVKALNKIHFD